MPSIYPLLMSIVVAGISKGILISEILCRKSSYISHPYLQTKVTKSVGKTNNIKYVFTLALKIFCKIVPLFTLFRSMFSP